MVLLHRWERVWQEGHLCSKGRMGMIPRMGSAIIHGVSARRGRMMSRIARLCRCLKDKISCSNSQKMVLRDRKSRFVVWKVGRFGGMSGRGVSDGGTSAFSERLLHI